MIVTTDTRLAPPPVLERRCVAIAALDALLEPEWQYRYHSYDADWAEGERMASMRTGEGERWHLVFGPDGCAGKWFAPQSGNDPSIVASAPDRYRPVMREPAFEPDAISGAIWFDAGQWTVVAASEAALREWEQRSRVLHGPEAYGNWANDYFDPDLPLDLVDEVFADLRVSAEAVERIAKAWPDHGPLLQELAEMKRLTLPV